MIIKFVNDYVNNNLKFTNNFKIIKFKILLRLH